jgi:hypothetical protein
MDAETRRQKAIFLEKELQILYGKTEITSDSSKLTGYRLQLANLEHQLSLLRLLQSEDRLKQNLWKLMFGVLGGVAGFIVKSFI